MPNQVKGRQGEELCSYVPRGTIKRVDEARGPYLSRSRFVLLALDRAIKEANSGILRIETERERNTPLSASVGHEALSGQNSSNASPNTPKEINPKESFAGVR